MCCKRGDIIEGLKRWRFFILLIRKKLKTICSFQKTCIFAMRLGRVAKRLYHGSFPETSRFFCIY